ncbi:hypothetical protein AVEN_160832-1 [Araneus ventricosus]|uniref:Uncharacterized protein n=1 Tax=Araneus ventricosus TaxID=182803 RepID=A0A4Y2UUN2_ARAVE|nr:hypothetical protein AVEN_160832-1 [Araneus ventricosus]
MKTETVCVQNADCTATTAARCLRCGDVISHRNEDDFQNPIISSDEATFHASNRVNISTTAEFGAQKIPMQYRKWKETVRKSIRGVLFYVIQL